MSSLECLLPDEPASEGPIQSCNRSKKWQQQNFEHFKIYPQKNCVCCNILLSNLRKKSVFLVLLYFSDYHSLCEILPGSIFLHQRCSWCQWRIARLEQLVGVSRLWGAISVHLLREKWVLISFHFWHHPNCLSHSQCNFCIFDWSKRIILMSLKNSFSVQSIYIKVCFSYFVLVCKRGVSV